MCVHLPFTSGHWWGISDSSSSRSMACWAQSCSMQCWAASFLAASSALWCSLASFLALHSSFSFSMTSGLRRVLRTFCASVPGWTVAFFGCVAGWLGGVSVVFLSWCVIDVEGVVVFWQEYPMVLINPHSVWKSSSHNWKKTITELDLVRKDQTANCGCEQFWTSCSCSFPIFL